MDGVMVLKRLTGTGEVLDSTLVRNKEFIWDPYAGRCSIFEMSAKVGINFCTVPMFFLNPTTEEEF